MVVLEVVAVDVMNVVMVVLVVVAATEAVVVVVVTVAVVVVMMTYVRARQLCVYDKTTTMACAGACVQQISER